MKKRLYIVIAVSLLSACGKKVPDDIIQPDAMESLLYDYHLASTMSTSLPYNETYKKEAYFDYVFQKHNVTEAEFDSSMVWYTRHAEELAAIYHSLQERLEREEKQMKEQVAKRDNQIDVSMSGDTVDVWQDRTMYWLSASSLTNKLTFDLKTDTTFRPRDAMALEADFHFIPSKGVSGKAVMALNFYFDNDSVQGQTHLVTRPGKQRLYLRPDSAFAIQSISGFIYYTDDNHPDATLLISDIRLTRYHQDVSASSVVSSEEQEVKTDTLKKTVQERQTINRSRLQPMRKIENRKQEE